MSAESYDCALDRAAERSGVESRFWDIFGRERVASVEARRAIVTALGIPADSADSIDSALAKHEVAKWTRVLAPCFVVNTADGYLRFTLSVPQAELNQQAHFRIVLEDGSELNMTHHLAGAHVEERRRFDMEWVSVRVEVPLTVPLGYHELHFHAGPRRASATLISAPSRAWQPDWLAGDAKTAGFAVSLYGLRSARNWGFGDFTDLHRLCDWAARELGVSFVGLNPLHSIHNRRPYNTSPYLPNSIYFQNSLYLDVEAIAEWAGCRRAQAAFRKAETQTELHLLRESPEVEYERVYRIKTRFLKLLFAQFLRDHWRKGTPRAREFESFREEARGLIERFGLYCALDEHLHRKNPNLWIWTDWPREYQDPHSPEATAFARKHWRAVLFFQYAAWQTDGQLQRAQEHAVNAGLRLGLYHDLALATDRFGADIWARPELFAKGCRVGSPPDDFSPHGQDWGFPPPNGGGHRECGYRFFRESIRRSCRHGGALRIDHVMRFFRLYWIPDGMSAAEGAYVRDRAEDLLRILALESVRNRVLIVGEDLGTVEPHIRDMLANYGILSYRLFYFERDGDGNYRQPHEYPRQALVSSTTHDLPTLSGFWQGSDIEARRAAGVLDDNAYRHRWHDRDREKQRMLDALWWAGLLPHDFARDARAVPEMNGVLRDAVVRFLSLTPSMILLVNQEDLTGERNQQNLPGTTGQYPNWARKMRWPLEQLDLDPNVRSGTKAMRAQLSASGRVLPGNSFIKPI